MPSAFGDPPDSGRNQPANAGGDSTSPPTSATGSAAASTRRRRRVLDWSTATASAVYGREGLKRPVIGPRTPRAASPGTPGRPRGSRPTPPPAAGSTPRGPAGRPYGRTATR